MSRHVRDWTFLSSSEVCVAKSHLQRNTLIGLFISLLLAAVKFAAGVLGLSSALVADAVESFADTIGSIFVWQALRVSSRPPDERHPYGYGKAEAVASLVVGGMLVVAALFIVSKAFHEIVVPHQAPAAWTIWVLLGVIATKEFLFRFVMRGADQFDSDAARADAWHHRSDAITSAQRSSASPSRLGTELVWNSRARIGRRGSRNSCRGVILITAATIIRPSLSELLDAASPEMIERVTEIAGGVDGVVDVEKVYVRKSGSGYHVDMHLHVDPDLTIRVAHDLGGKVKATLRQSIPNLHSVLIHIEPAERVPSQSVPSLHEGGS